MKIIIQMDIAEGVYKHKKKSWLDIQNISLNHYIEIAGGIF